MKMTTRCGAKASGLLLAVALLLTGCEEMVEEPSNENEPTTAPRDDTPRPPKAKPSTPKPAHGATGIAVNAILEWSTASGATSYQVHFGTDSTPDGDELQGDQTETSFDPGTLQYDTIYYWRVDSKNEIGTLTGDVWKFRTRTIPVPKPAKVSNPTPAHDATAVSRRPTLMWRAAPRATSYVVYLGTDAQLGSNERQGDEQTGTTFEPDQALQYDTTYYWRVDSKNDDGTTTGDVWSFTTEVKPARKTTNPQPADGATNVGILTDLSWSTAPDATSYVVYFGTARSPGPAERLGEQEDTTRDVSLVHNTTYYWRVDSKNDGGRITTGDVWSFTTGHP
ncbi:MAG: hypothetical protein OXQ89_21930 [Rhodospirillaceae bacterium]|nr:hypothetical protein [Rhodospirillaceae bacterium]